MVQSIEPLSPAHSPPPPPNSPPFGPGSPAFPPAFVPQGLGTWRPGPAGPFQCRAPGTTPGHPSGPGHTRRGGLPQGIPLVSHRRRAESWAALQIRPLHCARALRTRGGRDRGRRGARGGAQDGALPRALSRHGTVWGCGQPCHGWAGLSTPGREGGSIQPLARPPPQKGSIDAPPPQSETTPGAPELTRTQR